MARIVSIAPLPSPPLGERVKGEGETRHGFGKHAITILILVLLAAFLPGRSPLAAERHYLFYLHGAWLEMHSPEERHPVHGRYQYEEIVRALSEKGFEVTSEIRPQGTAAPLYADKVANEVRRLLESGVLPRQITVAGHSKGGLMTLAVAARLREPGINYVILAGCGAKGTPFRNEFEKFLFGRASEVKGRLLSIYDSQDREAGSCREVFGRARDSETREVVLNTGKGHGLFYSPSPVWMSPLADWAREKR